MPSIYMRVQKVATPHRTYILILFLHFDIQFILDPIYKARAFGVRTHPRATPITQMDYAANFQSAPPPPPPPRSLSQSNSCNLCRVLRTLSFSPLLAGRLFLCVTWLLKAPRDK